MSHDVNQRRGYSHITHFFAFTLNKHRSGWVQLAQRIPDQSVKTLLAGLRQARNSPQHRTAVVGQAFQVNHLRAGLRQCLQQAGLAGTGGAADHAPVQADHAARDILHKGRTKRLVAAFQQRHPKADLIKDQGQCAAALTATPAVGQGPPLLGCGHQLTLNVRSDVARG